MKIPGSRIRDLRELREWSTLDLARACDMREAFLIQIEDGIALHVHAFTYQKIADALGVTLAMLDGSEDIDDKKSLDEAVPEEYRWLIKVTMNLVITLGVLTLTLVVFLLGSLLLRFLLDLF